MNGYRTGVQIEDDHKYQEQFHAIGLAGRTLGTALDYRQITIEMNARLVEAFEIIDAFAADEDHADLLDTQAGAIF